MRRFDDVIPIPIRSNSIPAAYNQKTPLQVTISPKASENQHDFKLEKTVILGKR